MSIVVGMFVLRKAVVWVRTHGDDVGAVCRGVGDEVGGFGVRVYGVEGVGGARQERE